MGDQLSYAKRTLRECTEERTVLLEQQRHRIAQLRDSLQSLKVVNGYLPSGLQFCMCPPGQGSLFMPGVLFSDQSACTGIRGRIRNTPPARNEVHKHTCCPICTRLMIA